MSKLEWDGHNWKQRDSSRSEDVEKTKDTVEISAQGKTKRKLFNTPWYTDWTIYTSLALGVLLAIYSSAQSSLPSGAAGILSGLIDGALRLIFYAGPILLILVLARSWYRSANADKTFSSGESKNINLPEGREVAYVRPPSNKKSVFAILAAVFLLGTLLSGGLAIANSIEANNKSDTQTAETWEKWRYYNDLLEAVAIERGIAVENDPELSYYKEQMKNSLANENNNWAREYLQSGGTLDPKISLVSKPSSGSPALGLFITSLLLATVSTIFFLFWLRERQKDH